MNSSIYSADRATHLRIVVAALVASIGMVVFATALHLRQDDKYASVVRPRQNVQLSGPTAAMPPARRG